MSAGASFTVTGHKRPDATTFKHHKHKEGQERLKTRPDRFTDIVFQPIETGVYPNMKQFPKRISLGLETN